MSQVCFPHCLCVNVFQLSVHISLLKENVAMMAKGFAESTSMVVGRYPLSCS